MNKKAFEKGILWNLSGNFRHGAEDLEIMGLFVFVFVRQRQVLNTGNWNHFSSGNRFSSCSRVRTVFVFFHAYTFEHELM